MLNLYPTSNLCDFFFKVNYLCFVLFCFLRCEEYIKSIKIWEVLAFINLYKVVNSFHMLPNMETCYLFTFRGWLKWHGEGQVFCNVG